MGLAERKLNQTDLLNQFIGVTDLTLDVACVNQSGSVKDDEYLFTCHAFIRRVLILLKIVKNNKSTRILDKQDGNLCSCGEVSFSVQQ